MVSLKNKSLLFLTHKYSTFQKDQIEELAKYFKKVFVLVRYKPIAEIGAFFKIPASIIHSKKYAIDLTDKPKNVTVILVPLWYLPFNWFYKRLGNWHFKVVDKIIQKKKIKFDLIFAFFIWSSGYVGVNLKQKYNRPLIISARGYDIYELPFKDKDWKEKITKVLNSADQIITISQSNLRCLKKLQIKSPMRVIPNCYNEKLFYPKNQIKCRVKLHLPLDKKIILAIGYLEKIKGYKYLIEAMKLTNKKGENMNCYIIGDGSIRLKLQNQINKLDLNKNVFLLGAKPHHQLINWFNACDLFVLPSISESFGNVLLESLACGVPIVASNTGGIPEIIKSKDYGLLHKKGDVNDIEKKIDSALKKKWGTKKIFDYVTAYSSNNWSNQILSIIVQFIKNN